MSRQRAVPGVLAAALLVVLGAAPSAAREAGEGWKFNDSHFHLTNYIQEGTDLRAYVSMMGATVKRSTVFGIPLQQMWDHANTGDFAPTYYLESDAPLYYYSFTDAVIATSYQSLPPEQQRRLDPMITGFNPRDMYAVDHIRRVLRTFPGVFSGIGEFTIHKEFVSAKTAGGPASLIDPALDRVLEFAAESGLLVLLHNDVNMPFPKEGVEPWVLEQLGATLRRHPKATIVWAHCGLGRIVRPVDDQLKLLRRALADPGLKHVVIDISWAETAKYLTATPQAVRATAQLINDFPDRFLFGSDEVAPKSLQAQLQVYETYAPLWRALTPEASEKVRLKNYERLFDAATLKVRAWEKRDAAAERAAPRRAPASGAPARVP